MEEINKNTELDNKDKKLHISDVISRLYNLETYYMDIVDKSDLDGPEVKGRKSTYGSWVRLDDVRKLIDELKK